MNRFQPVNRKVYDLQTNNKSLSLVCVCDVFPVHCDLEILTLIILINNYTCELAVSIGLTRRHVYFDLMFNY